MTYKKLKYWFDAALAEMLANKLAEQQQYFDKEAFVKAVETGTDKLELKDRVELIADQLYWHLGEEYLPAVKKLVSILGPENEEETGMFTNYYWIMPVATLVEKYGLQHFEPSMQAIEEITKRNTGEYCIRPFLERYPEKTLQQMLVWSNHPNRHVRRLSCEGLRPRLPWAKKLDAFISDPSPILPILENLKDDDSKYVQKSAANCLNDILKDNLAIGQAVITSWQTPEASPARKWIIKHALRNLIKNKNVWALGVVD